MSDQFYKRWILTFVLISLMSISCRTLSLRRENLIQGERVSYVFDPNTIVADIEQGKTTNIFISQNGTPEPPLIKPFNMVCWTQADYLDIMWAFHKFLWKGAIEDWNIRHILFSMKCEVVSIGPQFAYFVLYKVDKIREEASRFEHQIYINPSENLISSSKDEYYPSLVHQRPIELSQHKIPINEVLQIAERNGGQKTRSAVDNSCSVRVQLFNSNNWRVSYVKVLDLFVIDVDAITGEFEIVNIR
jgi:hypothetical protein